MHPQSRKMHPDAPSEVKNAPSYQNTTYSDIIDQYSVLRVFLKYLVTQTEQQGIYADDDKGDDKVADRSDS